MKTIDPEKLHGELEKAGLPVAGVSSSGRMDFARPVSAEEQAKADAVLAAHDGAPGAEEADERLARFRKLYAGLPADYILFALWQAVSEGDRTVVEEVRPRGVQA